MAVTFEDRKASVTITQSWNGTGADPGGAQATVNHPGMAVVTIQVVGALNLTLIPEATTDEATFVALNAMNLNSGVKAQTITAAGLYRVDVAGARTFRVRCSAYTSGNPVVTVNAGFASTDAGSTSTGTGTGSSQVQGTAGTGTALSGNPVRVGASDGTNAQDLRVANGDALAKEGVLAVNNVVWNGTTFDRMFAASQRADGSSGVTMPTAPAYHFNGTNWDRTRSANSVSNTTGTGLQGVGPLVWDGTNWQKAAQASLAAGTTGTGLPGAGLLVFDGTNWQTCLNPEAATGTLKMPGVGVMVRAGSTSYSACRALTTSSDGAAGTNEGLIVTSLVFNGTNYDRPRNNQDVIIQASTATGVSTINTDIVTYNAGKLLVHVNVSNFNAGNLTVKLQWKDANGLFMDIPGATTGALAAGGPDFLLALGANSWPANTATAFYANLAVPRLVRIVQTIAAATVTYSAAYSTNCN